MDFMVSVFAAITAIEDGKIAEAEVTYIREAGDLSSERLEVVVRRSIKPFTPIPMDTD